MRKISLFTEDISLHRKPKRMLKVLQINKRA